MGILDFLSKGKEKEKGAAPPARTGGASRPAGRASAPSGRTDFSTFPFKTFFNSLEIGNPIIISANEDMGMKYESLFMGLEVEGNMIDSKKNIIHDDKGDFSIKVNEKFLRVQTDKAKQFSIIIPDTTQGGGGGGPAVGLTLDIGRKIYLKDPQIKTAPILETVVERTYTVEKGNYTNLPAAELRPVKFLNSNTDSRRTVRVSAKIPVKIQIPGETDKRLHTAIISDFNETGVKIGYGEGMGSLASLCTNATVGIYITKTSGPDGGPPEVMRYKGTVIWNKKNDSFGVRLGHIYKDKRFQPMQPIDGIILKGFLLNHPLCNS